MRSRGILGHTRARRTHVCPKCARTQGRLELRGHRALHPQGRCHRAACRPAGSACGPTARPAGGSDLRRPVAWSHGVEPHALVSTCIFTARSHRASALKTRKLSFSCECLVCVLCLLFYLPFSHLKRFLILNIIWNYFFIYYLHDKEFLPL